MRDAKVLVINPGSTSTKIGVFEGERPLFTKTVSHDANKLAEFSDITSQLPYRRKTILQALGESGVDLSHIDAFVGRGGGLMPMEGGTYEVNATMLAHARTGANGVQHPAQLGPLLANEFAVRQGKRAFVVNPPDTDELCDAARMTGIKGVYRHVHLHALNLKEVAIRHAASQGCRYEERNYIVCNLGGGVSVSAHRAGKMIDGYDIVGGDGAMAPTRCGGVPIVEVLDYLEAGHGIDEVRRLCMKSGGFVSLLGTSDAREVIERAQAGNEAAARAWEALLYQLSKSIAAMAGVLCGTVDAILLGGGMVHDVSLVKHIEQTCGWIAPVYAYPGEFELEAMAAGALRVLRGREKPKVYTGVPVFQGFDDERIERIAAAVD